MTTEEHTAVPPATATHPLDPLTAEEVRIAVAAVRASGRIGDDALFASVALDPPAKHRVVAHRDGDPVDRRICLVVLPGPGRDLVEVVVGVPGGTLESWVDRPGMCPAMLYEDCMRAMAAVRADPEWQAAMTRRGITDFAQVQIDPWPTGNFARPVEAYRRVARCLSYFREHPEDNGYARPVEGVIVTVDAGRGEVLEVADYGVVPIPDGPGSYYPEDNQPLRPDLRPIEIVQPDGPSFTVESNLIRWQGWSLRVSMDPNDGLVLHSVGIDLPGAGGRRAAGDRDGSPPPTGGTRSVLYRASISEMVVPYGDPGPVHGWKNAFDAGEWGLGRMANSLALGCDCLGEIRYLDAVFSTERGEPYVVKNTVCIHEEDFGILWKHQDMHSGRTEVRRSRRLVVSSIATVGNYEYGFYWYFFLDGSIQLEVKLTGILQTQAVGSAGHTRYSTPIAPGLAAPFHQHLFCARLDLAVDGLVNEVHEMSCEPLPAGADNPGENGFVTVDRRLDSELAARRDIEPAASRTWKFTNPTVHNGVGAPVAYTLVPGPSPTMLAGPGSSVARRAGFARHNLWVTPFRPEERRAAGDYPNQHPGGDGLTRWTAQDRSLVDTEIVAWHTFGVTHIPRPEDWPLMPVEYTGFHLVPFGFFDRNPALDVPPPVHACQSDRH